MTMPITARSGQVNDIIKSSTAAEGCAVKTSENFATKFYQTYKEHLKYDGENAAKLEHNGDVADAPLDSPPFPNATWSIGGVSPLGYADTAVTPLMDTIYCGENGAKIKQSRIKLYGWINGGGNISSSRSHYDIASGSGGNFPVAFDPYPNQFTLNQTIINLERVPDTVQRDRIDYGFRLTGIYGTDYKYTFSNHLFSDQYLKDHKKYGVDLMMFYGDIYIPYIAKGLNIKVGRYASIPDIETQFAPNNYSYSHSLLYTYGPYMHEGVVSSLKLNKNWTAQFEVFAGTDVAINDKRNRKLTSGACINWTSDSGNDNFYPCFNGINNGKYSYNNVQQVVATWYHKFNSKWHTATEGYYMWQRAVPSVDDANAPPIIVGSNGANCKVGDATCRASAFSMLNYISYKFTSKDSFTLRNEFFKDNRGQRTGYKTLYTEHTIGWNHWIGDVITIRPELRFDHSYDIKAYDGGRKASQYMLATDMIIRF